MSSIIKANEIQNSSGGAVVKMQTLKHPSASGNSITLASDGSATIANGTLSAGTINSAVAIQQKTALLTGEHNNDFDPVADNSDKTLHTFNLNTELDPYNFVTLNSSTNTVTVTEAGTYDISWHTGSILVWIESGSGTYCQSYLEVSGTDTKKGNTTYVLDHNDRSGGAGTPTFSKGNWVGTLSANATLKIRGKTGALTNGLRSWTSFTGSGNNNVWAHMLIQKIG